MHRAFRPLRQIEDTAAAIADGDLARRIPTRTAKDEVTSLSRSLNVMLAQIEQSFAAREASEERMRQFVADASHELRTPLAAVRGYAELYRQGAVREPADVASAMTRIEGEATRMGGLVEDLLMLARLDDQRPLRFAPVDLTVLAADAAQDARAIDPTRQITVSGLLRAARARPWPRATTPSCASCWPTSSPTPSTTPLPAHLSKSLSAQGNPTSTSCSRCATTAPGSTPTRRARCSSGSTAPTRRGSAAAGGGNGLGPGHRGRHRQRPPGPDRRRPDRRRRRDLHRRAAHRQLSGSAQHPLTLAGLTEVTKPHQGARTP